MTDTQWLRGWFAAPVFPNEEEKSRQAYLINLIIQSGLVLVSVIFVLLPWVSTPTSETRFFVAVVTIFFSLGACKFGLNAGRVHETGYFLTAVLWGTFAIITMTGPEGLTGTPFIGIVTLTPLVAGFVSGTRTSVFVTMLNWVLGGVLVWLELTGNLPANVYYDPISQYLALMVMYSSFPMLVFLWRRNFTEAIEQVRAVNLAQQETAAYRLENEALEGAVKARTSALEESLAREQDLAEKLATSLELETQLGELQSRIITVVSHEFRTPLSVISSSSELLQQYYERLTPERRDAVHLRIREAVFYLNDLLKDVTLVDQAKRERIRPSYQTFLFYDLCQKLSERILREVNRPLRVTFQYAASLHSPVQTDLNLLQQIAANLVSNALKYSAEESLVQVRFWLNERNFVLEVQDEGIGIPLQEQAKVFELFYRASNVDERRGLGLGLFIVQAISSMMQGETLLMSRGFNQGTTIQVYLPITPVAEQVMV